MKSEKVILKFMKRFRLKLIGEHYIKYQDKNMVICEWNITTNA